MKNKYIIVTSLVLVGLLALAVLIFRINQWSQDHIIKTQAPVTLQSPVVVEEVEPEIEVVEIPPVEGNEIALRVSHYWPELGGTNCGNFVDGECVSKMANGQPWQEWVGVAIACPPELAFGTIIKIGEREWVCKDRGSAIQKVRGAYWVDMLTPYALYDYNEVVIGELVE